LFVYGFHVVFQSFFATVDQARLDLFNHMDQCALTPKRQMPCQESVTNTFDTFVFF
jgi:hypothetical protein